MIAVINSTTNTLYLMNEYKENLAKLQIKNGGQSKWEIIKNLVSLGTGAKFVVIQNQFHVIGGFENHKHLVLNENTNKFQVLHDLGASDNIIMNHPLQNHGIVQVKDNVLMFGGYDGYLVNRCTADICKYDIIGNKWTKLASKMPVALSEFGMYQY